MVKLQLTEKQLLIRMQKESDIESLLVELINLTDLSKVAEFKWQLNICWFEEFKTSQFKGIFYFTLLTKISFLHKITYDPEYIDNTLRIPKKDQVMYNSKITFKGMYVNNKTSYLGSKRNEKLNKYIQICEYILTWLELDDSPDIVMNQVISQEYENLNLVKIVNETASYYGINYIDSWCPELSGDGGMDGTLVMVHELLQDLSLDIDEYVKWVEIATIIGLVLCAIGCQEVLDHTLKRTLIYFSIVASEIIDMSVTSGLERNICAECTTLPNILHLHNTSVGSKIIGNWQTSKLSTRKILHILPIMTIITRIHFVMHNCVNGYLECQQILEEVISNWLPGQIYHDGGGILPIVGMRNTGLLIRVIIEAIENDNFHLKEEHKWIGEQPNRMRDYESTTCALSYVWQDKFVTEGMLEQLGVMDSIWVDRWQPGEFNPIKCGARYLGDVYVIDKTIYNIRSKWQLPLMLAMSKWITRGWTYQEALNAQNLHFVTRQGVYTVSMKDRDWWNESKKIGAIEKLFNELLPYGNDGDHSITHLRRLQAREWTYREDIVKCQSIIDGGNYKNFDMLTDNVENGYWLNSFLMSTSEEHRNTTGRCWVPDYSRSQQYISVDAPLVMEEHKTQILDSGLTIEAAYLLRVYENSHHTGFTKRAIGYVYDNWSRIQLRECIRDKRKEIYLVMIRAKNNEMYGMFAELTSEINHTYMLHKIAALARTLDITKEQQAVCLRHRITIGINKERGINILHL